MLAALLMAALLSQQPASPAGDTLRTVPDSTASRSGDEPRRPPRRIPLTPALERSAFDDTAARVLLGQARAARMRQDSTLTGYDATAYQRISVGMGLRRVGRERLLFRREVAARVRWQRDVGAFVDVLGGRQALPMVQGRSSAKVNVEAEMGDDDYGDVPIPYYPGQETLWIGSEMAKMEVNDRELVHPIADGAEAYYKYAIGDSVVFRLPDGRTIRLRELRVRPREPKWNLGVGSLWFDASTAQLVRAVYRLSVPMDIWQVALEEDSTAMDDVPRWVKPALTPMRATVSAMTVEYGLQEGRFWLPRLQAFDAQAEVSFMRVPVRLEQSFKYASVNGALPDSMPSIPDVAAERARNRAWRDSIRALPSEVRDSLRTARRTARVDQCAGGADQVRTSTRNEYDGALSVLVRVPCDSAKLARSSELPPSIYDAGDELWGGQELDALVNDALSFAAQAEWAPQRPVLNYGLGDGLLRYNRVEGLSPAVQVTQQLGAGYTGRLLARIGTADWVPRGELSLSRSDGRRTITVAGYNKLGVANDWGDPLGFGASTLALLFGRDEGFFYRAGGAEVRLTGSGDGTLEARAFVERQSSAPVETQVSVPNALGDHQFIPNIAAERGNVAGLAARASRTWGVNPDGWRTFVDARGEVGSWDFGYVRALADVTVSHPLVAAADGSLTVSGGGSAGDLPAQRRYYLGGPHTIRGQAGGAMVGDAFWMARAEVGHSFTAVRPTLFYDVGWAGDRDQWRHPGTVGSGVGAGLSFLDGLMRVDLAHGFQPERQWRLDLYLEARF